MKKKMFCRFRMFAFLAPLCSPFLAACQQPSQLTPSPDIREFYPLAVGNIWVYAVRKEVGSPVEKVQWKVTQEMKHPAGSVFVVWPSPAQADDEAMELLWDKEGLKEISSDSLLLGYPAREGAQWKKEFESVLHGRKVTHSFTIISVNKPCRTERLTFSDCIVVEDTDEELALKRVTEYARNIGPVKYSYFSLHGSGRPHGPIQVVELISHKFASDKTK